MPAFSPNFKNEPLPLQSTNDNVESKERRFASNSIILPTLLQFPFQVRAGNDEATMAYGRSELCGGDAPGGATEAVQEVVGLLAYPDPQASPLAYLLEQGRRKAVSDELNAALKGTSRTWQGVGLSF